MMDPSGSEADMISLPLRDKKIAVTRDRFQAAKLSDLLLSYGATVIEFPTIEVRALDDLSLLGKAIRELGSYHWIFFTSQNAVNIFFNKLESMGLVSNALEKIKTGVVGPSTAMQLERYGIKPDLVPDEFIAEGLVEASARAGVKGKRVLLPSAAGARDALEDGLVELGAEVVRINTYHSVMPDLVSDESRIAVMEADVVTFTSSSTAANFFLMVPDIESIYACIGPATAKTVRELGREPHIVAEEFTLDGLVDAIIAYYSGLINSS